MQKAGEIPWTSWSNYKLNTVRRLGQVSISYQPASQPLSSGQLPLLAVLVFSWDWLPSKEQSCFRAACNAVIQQRQRGTSDAKQPMITTPCRTFSSGMPKYCPSCISKQAGRIGNSWKKPASLPVWTIWSSPPCLTPQQACTSAGTLTVP